jgi:hypothetical protein
MTPQDAQTFWPMFLFGIPIILLGGGPWGWRALVLLGAIAGLAYAPMITIPLAILWCLRWLVADFFLAFIAGLGGGLGLRAAGIFNRRRSPPRRLLRDRWRDRR